MVFGSILLSFLFAEGIGSFYQGLFTEHGIDLIVTWTTILGPYVAYLLIRSIVWLLKSTVLLIRTMKYVVEVSHKPQALAVEERLSGRFAVDEAGLAENAKT